MNICSLGRQLTGSDIPMIEFASTRTILDFHVVVVDLPMLANHKELSPGPCSFRKQQFVEFLSLGRTLIVLSGPIAPEVCLPVSNCRMEAVCGRKTDCKGPDYLKTFWTAVQRDMEYLAVFQKPLGQPFLFVAETEKVVASLLRFERGHIIFLPWLRLADHPIDSNDINRRFLGALTNLTKHLEPKRLSLSRRLGARVTVGKKRPN